MYLSKKGAEDSNENENKKLWSREKGWSGWICISWKRRLWGQDKKEHSNFPKARELSHREQWNSASSGDTTIGIGLSHSKEDEDIFCQVLEQAAERIFVHGGF